MIWLYYFKTLVNYQSVAIKVVMGIDNTTEINILMNIKNPYILSYKKYFVEDISTCDGILWSILKFPVHLYFKILYYKIYFVKKGGDLNEAIVKKIEKKSNFFCFRITLGPLLKGLGALKPQNWPPGAPWWTLFGPFCDHFGQFWTRKTRFFEFFFIPDPFFLIPLY